MSNNTTESFEISVGWFAIGDSILNTFGLFGNGAIIAATLNPVSQLHSKANYCIAILAACDLLSNAGGCLMAYLWNVFDMSVTQCFYTLLFYLFSINAGAAMIVMVGVDRMLAISVPIQYEMWRTKRYVTALAFPAVLYGLSCIFMGFVSLPVDTVIGSFCGRLATFLFFLFMALMIPLCMPPTAFFAVSMDYFVLTNLAICIVVVVVYGIVYRKASKLGFGGKSNSSAEINKRKMLTSLIIVTTMFVFSWFLTIVVLAVLGIVGVTPSQEFHISTYVGWGSSLNISCNGYIYAFRSADYRREMCRLFGITVKENRVTTVQASKMTEQKI